MRPLRASVFATQTVLRTAAKKRQSISRLDLAAPRLRGGGWGEGQSAFDHRTTLATSLRDHPRRSIDADERAAVTAFSKSMQEAPRPGADVEQRFCAAQVERVVDGWLERRADGETLVRFAADAKVFVGGVLRVEM